MVPVADVAGNHYYIFRGLAYDITNPVISFNVAKTNICLVYPPEENTKYWYFDEESGGFKRKETNSANYLLDGIKQAIGFTGNNSTKSKDQMSRRDITGVLQQL